MKRFIKRIDTKTDRTGKGLVLDEELSHFPRSYISLVVFAVGLHGAAGFEQRHPLNRVDIAADLLTFGQQNVILDVKDPRGSICALKKFPELDELPTLVVRHGRVSDTLEQLATFKRPLKKLIGAGAEKLQPFARAEYKKHSVQLFPHLGRNLFADSSSVFSGESETGKDRIWILALERDEFDDRVTGKSRIKLLKELGILE